VRGGWFVAEGVARHGRPPERHRVHEAKNIWFYGAALPIASIALAPVTLGISLLVAAAFYARHVSKVYGDRIRHGNSPRDARLYATYCTLGKLPEAVGQTSFWLHRLLRRDAKLIEYKNPEPTGT
jgi:hypothetical protein